MKLTATQRRWMYGVACAGIALGGVYGIVSGEEADAWMIAVAAVLNVARRNVNDDE